MFYNNNIPSGLTFRSINYNLNLELNSPTRRDDIINIQGDNDIPSGFKGIL
jgi:hypothetical protein